MIEEEPKPVYIGPIKEYNVFLQVANILARAGYFLYLKLVSDGWTAECRTRIRSEDE